MVLKRINKQLVLQKAKILSSIKNKHLLNIFTSLISFISLKFLSFSNALFKPFMKITNINYVFNF